MSELTIAGEAKPGRPLWLAWLAGWLVPVTIGWILVLVLIEIDNARLDSVDAFEGDGVVRPPSPFTFEWLENAATAYVRMAIFALAYALPLLFLLARLARRTHRASAWALAGLAAMTLPAAALTAFVLLDARATLSLQYVAALLILAVLGLAGGGTARLVRHEGR